MTSADVRAYRARWILPITAAPIAGGVVEIVEGRITHVGPRAKDATQVQDLGDVTILPALVNAHTHLEFSALDAPLGTPAMSFPDWIRAVIHYRRTRDVPADAAIRRGWQQSQAAGVAAVGEIATIEDLSIYDESPIGVTAFCEAIGLADDRVTPVLADVERRVSQRTSSSRWQVGISQHAPYTVHPELFARLVALATERSLPVSFHLAESREELQHLRECRGPFFDMLSAVPGFWQDVIPRGTRPLDYLRVLAQAPRSLVIHGNYLAADEIEFVAQQRERMAVVYCPRTHAQFGHEPYPLRELLTAGAAMALGTDSRASNPDLSLLAEMRHVAATFADLAPAMILEIGTLGGARALGLDGELGSLEVGKRAEIVSVPLTGESNDPLSHILHSNAPISPLPSRDRGRG